MFDNAGPSKDGSASARSARVAAIAGTTTSRRSAQEQIAANLIAAFLPEHSSSRAAQKARAIDVISKDTWSPADGSEVAASIRGLCRKHKINLSSELARALQLCYTELLSCAAQAQEFTESLRDSNTRRGLSSDIVRNPLIRPENVADIVQLLLVLSRPADVTSRTAALLMLNATEPRRTTYLSEEQRRQKEKSEWLSILLDDPLVGEAWTEEPDNEGSDLSEWSANSEDAKPKDQQQRQSDQRAIVRTAPTQGRKPQQERELEAWTQSSVSRRSALAGVMASIRLNDDEQLKGDVSELDAIRECLHALMGHDSILFRRTPRGTFELRGQAVNSNASKQSDILSQLGQIADAATALANLREFVCAHIAQSVREVNVQSRFPAVEAFAEQVQGFLHRLDLHLSEYDSDIAAHLSGPSKHACRREIIVTLPHFVAELETIARTPFLLGRMLRDLGWLSSSSIELSDKDIIDSLQALSQVVSDAHSTAEHDTLLEDLGQCSLASAAPAWLSVCKVIGRGLSFAAYRDHDTVLQDRLLSHMFRHSQRLHTADSEFWRTGYTVFHDANGTLDGVPNFLRHVIVDVLVTAKGVGLLRSLGIDALGDMKPSSEFADAIRHPSHPIRPSSRSQPASDAQKTDVTAGQHIHPFRARKDLRSMLFGSANQIAESSIETGLITPPSEVDVNYDASEQAHHLASLLEPQLSQFLRQHLSPIISIVKKRVLEVFTSPSTQSGCSLFAHLTAIHGLYLMQEGTDMSDWLESIFGGLLTPNGSARALETHRLTGSLRDVVEDNLQKAGTGSLWIDTSLVRFVVGDSASGSVARSRSRLQRLDDVRLEYLVPWPATYCFPSESLSVYQTIFTLLLRIKYAHWRLSSTLKLSRPDTVHLRHFWVLRKDMQWLVLVLMDFFQRDVLTHFSGNVRKELEGAASLDAIIEVHTAAVAKLRKVCFLETRQVGLQELFNAATTLADEVVYNYESLIGQSSREDDRRARKNRKDRRKRRKARGKQTRTPLGAIVEEDEDEDDDDGESDQGDREEEASGVQNARVGVDYIDTSGFDFSLAGQADASASLLSTSSFDMSTSNVSAGNWIASEFAKKELFERNIHRHRKAFIKIVDNLELRIDEQVERLTSDSTAHVTTTQHALEEQNYYRQHWQALLYSLEGCPK